MADETLQFTDSSAMPEAAVFAPSPGPAAMDQDEPDLLGSDDLAPSVEDLPIYSRSLLRIEVPVIVTLARKRQPLARVVELGPGAIIHFNKPCDQMLDLEVGNRVVAQGEAVKVGDKFGLRVTSMVLPEERFNSVKKG